MPSDSSHPFEVPSNISALPEAPTLSEHVKSPRFPQTWTGIRCRNTSQKVAAHGPSNHLTPLTWAGWERMIGPARRILDTMFLQLGFTGLTHETLSTLWLKWLPPKMQGHLLLCLPTLQTLCYLPPPINSLKVVAHTAPIGDFNTKDENTKVHSLANTLLDKWRRQYLLILQT